MRDLRQHRSSRSRGVLSTVAWIPARVPAVKSWAQPTHLGSDEGSAFVRGFFRGVSDEHGHRGGGSQPASRGTWSTGNLVGFLQRFRIALTTRHSRARMSALPGWAAVSCPSPSALTHLDHTRSVLLRRQGWFWAEQFGPTLYSKAFFHPGAFGPGRGAGRRAADSVASLMRASHRWGAAVWSMPELGFTPGLRSPRARLPRR